MCLTVLTHLFFVYNKDEERCVSTVQHITNKTLQVSCLHIHQAYFKPDECVNMKLIVAYLC